uniref:Outer capsid glycoprotein VP7 n=1 Tax=Wild duck Rotavirus G-like TaxID=2592522 RepID=A0A5B8KEJ9_9REOV|nr:viral structural protein 7 [Wild duck Rotavirus G-like]
MFGVTLLSLVVIATAQITIKPISKRTICILHYEEIGDKDLMSNFTNVFSSYAGVHIEFSKYDSGEKDVVKILSNARLDGCEVVAVHIEDSDMDFVSFMFSQNECMQLKGDKIHYFKLSREQEYFLYGKELHFCPLSDNMIGMNCDTNLNDTYFPMTSGSNYEVIDIPEFTNMGYTFYSEKDDTYFPMTSGSNYEVIDIPEFTNMGYTFYSEKDDFYLCERTSSNYYSEVYLFHKDSENYGTIVQRVNWGNVWTHFRTLAQVVYGILDVFFGGRSVEPRA